jgi:hypothetical protein
MSQVSSPPRRRTDGARGLRIDADAVAGALWGNTLYYRWINDVDNSRHWPRSAGKPRHQHTIALNSPKSSYIGFGIISDVGYTVDDRISDVDYLRRCEK